MRRIATLIALGFVVLTGATVLGVHLAERGASERRAERFGRSLIESIRSGGQRHVQALGASELSEIEARAGSFDQGVTLVRRRLADQRWELAYCLESGEPFQLWVPEPNPRKRARLLFSAPDDAPGLCVAP